ncbi:response regulator transcription factor [Streptomyces sp. NPDC057877]|uniref:response regulator transcription factor n=1 Tax=Streptomyces sp. NPDC057877 TaxID=3346269 RepID=UPI0036A24EFE
MDPLATLTPEEREVLALMAEGHSHSGIAGQLLVTVPAVERHVTGIFVKLGLGQATSSQHRRVSAVLRHLRQWSGSRTGSALEDGRVSAAGRPSPHGRIAST